MELKLIHTADWHLNYEPAKLAKAEQSINQLVEYCQKEKVNGIIISGDIWDSLQSFGDKSAVNLCFDSLARLSSLVNFIFLIKGNNAHDAVDSINPLHNYRPNIWAFERNVALLIDLIHYQYIDLCQLPEIKRSKMPSVLIHGFPYPNNAGLIQEGSINENNFNFLKKFEELLQYHGTISSQYPDTPAITAFHGNVAGCKLSNGQRLKGQEIIVPPSLLELTRARYYALGHIHLPQQIKWNMRQSGSLYNINYGETEQKFFNVVKIKYGIIDQNNRESFPMEIEQIRFVSSRPMINIEAQFKDGKFVYENHIPANAEKKFHFTVTENERHLVTKEILQELRNKLGEDTIIVPSIIPIQRESRSIKISKCKTLQDEVIEWGNVIKNEATLGILNKVQYMLENNYAK
jgi:DNA repair exonuclease SbcCD nuclease subunit